MTGSENASKFLWGAASSAFQVEGHPHAGGRGRSKWDVYKHDYRITEAVVGVQHDADVAINAYDRAQSLADIAIMRDAGLDAYRFSISWPRIFPEGVGTVNSAGVDHYSRFVDDLLTAGIKPLATLYHWDFPWPLHEKGGWHNRDVAGWFSDYASTAFRALGDRVDTFVTINEPQIDLFMMDLIATKVRDGAADPWAWSSADIAGQGPAMHNLLRANAAAVAAYRSLGLPGMIGIALPLYPTIPLNPKRAEDVAAAGLLDGLMNRWPLDAVFLGTYPDDVIAALQKHNLSFVPPAADLAAIAAAPVDFLGVNYYSPAIVEFDDRFPLDLRWGNAETNPDPVKAFNGPVRPDELRKLLLRIRDDYGNPPTFVTENGAGFGDFDEVMEPGTVRDPLRTDYILRHAAATVAARDEGADVRGYMCWSLFDNFEWIQGYTRRFGMVHVDFTTQKRTLKQSFRAYRDMIARTRGG